MISEIKQDLAKLRCLIVDDEQAAHYVLEHYISQVDRLELAGGCGNALEAINCIHREKIDLIFLDINMPQINGLEMLKTLNNPPLVILTTAYSNYALESYSYDVVDYLLKPIQLTRFLKAVDKSFLRYGLRQPTKTVVPAKTSRHDRALVIKVDGDWVRITLDEIMYVQSWGNYVKIHIDGQTLLTPLTLTELQERLTGPEFIRIHKSYLVPLKQIDRLSGNMVYIHGHELPVGSTYRRELIRNLE